MTKYVFPTFIIQNLQDFLQQIIVYSTHINIADKVVIFFILSFLVTCQKSNCDMNDILSSSVYLSGI